MDDLKVKRIPRDVIYRSHPSGVMSEVQLEAFLWGFFALVLKSRDRRAGGRSATNAATGLPESAGDLLPIHRATVGWELALDLLIPPEDFVAAFLRTDDLEQNVGKSESEKVKQALSYKPKFKRGRTGRELIGCRCLACGEEWREERGDLRKLAPDGSARIFAGAKRTGCRVCFADYNLDVEGEKCTFENGRVPHRNVVETAGIDNWSEGEVFAVKTNARTLKRIVHRLAGSGYFLTKPKIDERAEGELGTDVLDHGTDGLTIGFAITPKGLAFAEAFVKKNPELQGDGRSTERSTLDAMGEDMAKLAPQWFQSAANKKAEIELG